MTDVMCGAAENLTMHFPAADLCDTMALVPSTGKDRG
jgi:hypothetical protein